jgi:hypothetical protein
VDLSHREIIAVYFENHIKSVTHCGQNAELLNVKEGGTYSYHNLSVGKFDTGWSMMLGTKIHTYLELPQKISHHSKFALGRC